MMDRLISILQGEVRRLSHRVQMVFTLGRTTTSVNDSGPIRMVQARMGGNQLKDNLPLMQQFGFASNPPVGCDLAVSSINGDRTVCAAVASNHQTYCVKSLGEGATAIYDAYGNIIVMSSGGILLYSPTSYEWNVGGYGQKITATGGGNFVIDNYTTGATVTTNNHPVTVPVIP